MLSRSLRRRIALAVAVLISPLLLYWLAAYLFFSTEWGYRWIHSPESRTEITWTSGRSWIPGMLEVEGLQLVGKARQVDWRVSTEKAQGRFSWGALMDRKLRFIDLSISGLEADIQRVSEPRPRRPPKDDAWWIEAEGLVADEVRSITYDDWMLRGQGTLRGAFRTRSRGGPYEQLPTRLDFTNAELLQGQNSWLKSATAVLEIEIAEHLPRQSDTLAFTDAQLRLDGALHLPERLLEPLREADVEIGGSEGTLRLELPVEKGSAAPGAFLDLEIPGTAATLGEDYEVSGKLAARLELQELQGEEGDGDEAQLQATIEGRDLEIRGSRQGQVLRASAQRVSLGQALGLPQGTEIQALSRAMVRVAQRANAQRGENSDGKRRESAKSSSEAPPKANTEALSVPDSASAPGSLKQPSPPDAAQDSPQIAALSWEELQLELEKLELQLPLRRGTLSLKSDQASADLQLAPLANRHLELPRFAGQGIEVLYAPRAGSSSAPSSNSWSISAPNLKLEDVRQLRFGQYQARDVVSAEGRVQVERGGRYRVNDARMKMTRGQLLVADRSVIEGLDLDADLDYGPATAGRGQGRELLRPLSGEIQIGAHISSLAPLGLLLQGSSAVTLDGQGELSADLFFQRGRLLPASRVSAKTDSLEVVVLDNQVLGDARLLAEVSDTSQGPRATLDVTFRRFSYGPRDQPADPLVVGEGFTLKAQSQSLDLATDAFSDARVDVRLPPSRIPDMSRLSESLPRASGLAFGSRPGTLESQLTFHASDDSADGRIHLNAEDMLLRWGGVSLQGTLDMAARLSSEDLSDRRFRLSQTEILLQPAEITDDAQNAVDDAWWLQLNVPEGAVRWSRPLEVTGTLHLQMKNTALLAALFLDRSRRTSTWLARALTTGPVDARAEIRLGSRQLLLDPVEAELQRFQLRSRLRFKEDGLLGQFLLEYGNFAIGVDLRDQRRRYHARGSRDWYDSREGWPSPRQ